LNSERFFQFNDLQTTSQNLHLQKVYTVRWPTLTMHNRCLDENYLYLLCEQDKFNLKINSINDLTGAKAFSSFEGQWGDETQAQNLAKKFSKWSELQMFWQFGNFGNCKL